MELLLKRKIRTDKSTIGELFVDEVFQCFILEDKDRGLSAGMTLDELKKKKVYAQTAIPAGRYQVALTFSNRFQTYLPILLEVPAYEGIRIHSGNTSANTEGCLLPGTSYSTDFVSNSKAAFRTLFAKLKAVEKKEKIFITIQN
jgi:hypothetical protein